MSGEPAAEADELAGGGDDAPQAAGAEDVGAVEGEAAFAGAGVPESGADVLESGADMPEPEAGAVFAGADAPEPEAGGSVESLACVIEALLFLSSDPLSAADLADAAEAGDAAVAAALELLGERLAPGCRGVRLRELAGGFVLASDPGAEAAARRLFSRPRLATLTPAQAETLSIVAYMQPISRPEISRIRGVSADSAAATLLERGLIEEAGRSQFGAALYRTSTAFLKLFGLRSLEELPEVTKWDPSPEEQAELRDRLLRAGDARAGGGPGSGD